MINLTEIKALVRLLRKAGKTVKISNSNGYLLVDDYGMDECMTIDVQHLNLSSMEEILESKPESNNNEEELAINIEYCPYCGSDVIERTNEVDMYCMDCGKDFRIMTQN